MDKQQKQGPRSITSYLRAGEGYRRAGAERHDTPRRDSKLGVYYFVANMITVPRTRRNKARKLKKPANGTGPFCHRSEYHLNGYMKQRLLLTATQPTKSTYHHNINVWCSARESAAAASTAYLKKDKPQQALIATAWTKDTLSKKLSAFHIIHPPPPPVVLPLTLRSCARAAAWAEGYNPISNVWFL